jgi:hypothetical protein
MARSRLREELTDPWGPVLAGIVGGVAIAATLPVAAGVGIAAAVYGVKVVVGSLMGGGEDGPPPPPLPRQGTPARIWIDRAEDAVHALQRMSPSTPLTAADSAAQSTAEQAAVVLDTMRRLGGQVVALTNALGHADSPGLDEEARRLDELARSYPDDASTVQSAQALADRVAVRDRLRRARFELDGRLQSSALGLEGLVARVAEVRAASHAVGQIDPTADDLEALTAEVEGLRIGLRDVEQVAQKALRS